MPARSLAILAISTLASVATCSFVANGSGQSNSSDQSEYALVFPELQEQAGDISIIEVNRPNEQFTLSKLKESWSNQGAGGFPARTERIEKTITELSKLYTLAAKTKRNELHYKIGVEQINKQSNSTQLTLKNALGTPLADIIIGKQKGGFDNQQVYIRLPADNQAWLASGHFDVAYDAIDWSEHTVTDFAASTIAAVKLNNIQQAPLVLERTPANSSKLTINNLPDGTRIANQFQIDYIAGALEALSFHDARSYSDSKPTAPVLLKAEFELLSQLALTILVFDFQKDGSAWASVSAKLTNNAAENATAADQMTAINEKFSGWQIQLPRKTIDRLKIQLDDIIE